METRKKLFFAAVLMFGLWALYGSAWAVDDMFSYWKFDEGEGTIAYDSIGTNYGTVYGATWATGQIGGALDFDGIDDYVEIPDSDDFDFGIGEFSISVWFKTSVSSRDQYIIDFYGPANTPHIEIYTSYGKLGTHIMPGDKRIRYGSVADGEWHHGAITLANGASYGYRLYLDGVNVGRTSYSGFLANWETISIATRDLGYPNKPFDGKIDEVRIYDRALSAEEIWGIYMWYPTELLAIDIKPRSCPNPLNVKSNGLLPMAILGSQDFDVYSIDVASIRLAGVAPIRSSFEDVGTPLVDANECECSTEGPDGFPDLTLKFETQSIVEAIGEVDHGDELVLELIGVLSDETPIEGSDCVIIRGKHKPLNKADFNGDGIVNMADLSAFSENWLQSSIVEY
jgi:hypothetical protein